MLDFTEPLYKVERINSTNRHFKCELAIKSFEFGDKKNLPNSSVGFALAT